MSQGDIIPSFFANTKEIDSLRSERAAMAIIIILCPGLTLVHTVILSCTVQALLRTLFHTSCIGAPRSLDAFLMHQKYLTVLNTVAFFNILADRGLPEVVVRFLSRWYNQQMLTVR